MSEHADDDGWLAGPDRIVDIPISGSLTHPYRHVTWVNVNPTGNPALGIMTIRERISPTRAFTYHRYLVQELAFVDGFRFRLTKPQDRRVTPEDAEPYHVHLAVVPGPKRLFLNGNGVACDCRGFQTSKSVGCKHSTALYELVGAGHVAGVRATLINMRTGAGV